MSKAHSYMAVFLAATLASTSLSAQEPKLTRTGARKTLVVTAIERTKGAVVDINCDRASGKGSGTGIIMDSRGWIVTNYHVVERVTALSCVLENGVSCKAKVMGKFPARDLALLKIDAKESLPTMPCGTAGDLMLGETVIAIGYAQGYEHSVSVGVVSGLKREVEFSEGQTYKGLIQTDVALNPGGSGGPLINIFGELIGVNMGVLGNSQNMSFAITVDKAIDGVQEMLRTRRSTYTGAQVRDHVTDGGDGLVRTARADNVDNGGPAYKAGMKKGDVVVKVGDFVVASGMDFERALIDRKAGDSLAVVVRRADGEHRLTLVLAKKSTALY